MINDYSKLLGAIFFKKDGDKVSKKLRMIGFANTEFARMENIETKETEKIKYTELVKDWIMLNPDGYFYFNIVELDQGIQDVIVCMYRESDIAQNSSDPYVTCRQNITNVLGALININDGDVGCCMSLETVPDGVDYKIMRACNKVLHFVSVAYYTTDKLDDIIHCIKKIDKYDDVLNTLFENSIKKFYPEFVWDMVQKENRSEYKGYCKTLKGLLEHNEFMYETRRGFGIGTLDIDILAHAYETTGEEDVYYPDGPIQDIIEKQYNMNLVGDMLLMKYDKDVNLSLNVDKIIFFDNTETPWILFYTKDEHTYIDTHVPNTSEMSPADKIEAAFLSNNL